MEPGVPGEVREQAAGDKGQVQARYVCVETGMDGGIGMAGDGWGDRDGWRRMGG